MKPQLVAVVFRYGGLLMVRLAVSKTANLRSSRSHRAIYYGDKIKVSLGVPGSKTSNLRSNRSLHVIVWFRAVVSTINKSSTVPFYAVIWK